MKEIGLSGALRYLFTGLVPLGLLYICDRDSAKNLISDLGPIGVSLLVIAWGSIAYHIYRPLLYQRVIAPLQDTFRRNSDSPRAYLAKRYGITCYRAAILWAYVAHDALRDYRPSWRREASGIHLMYISAITSFGFAAWQFVEGSCRQGLLMLIIAIVIGVGGFFHDRLAEDYEIASCRALGETELDEYARKFGIKS